jgi:quercetin dioxygenase-like cupin family protein
VPTIAVLLKVANGLNRRPSELLADVEAGKQVAVLPSSDRQQLEVPGRARLEHLAAMIPRSRLDVWRVDLEPGHGPGTNGEDWQFNGEIVLLVEDGQLELEIQERSYKAGPGDSIHFDTSIPHRWQATAGRKATCIVFALLPERLQGDLLTRIAMSSGIGRDLMSRTVSVDSAGATQPVVTTRPI